MPLCVSLLRTSKVLIAASGSRPPRRCSSLSVSSPAGPAKHCFVVSNGPCLTRRVSQPASQPASQSGCHVPVQLPSCQSPLSSPPSAVMYDTIARRKLFSVHSEAGGPVHQHRDPSLSLLHLVLRVTVQYSLCTCSPPSIGRTLFSPSPPLVPPRPPASPNLSPRLMETPHGQRCRHKSTKEAIRRRRRRHPGKSPPRLRRECSQTAVSGIDQYTP